MARMNIKDLDPKLSKEEKTELLKADKMPITPDNDCPEMTPEKLRQFKKLHQQEQRRKETVSLRVSHSTLNIAKAYGKGYTAFLGRLLDEAIKDENLVKKCI